MNSRYSLSARPATAVLTAALFLGAGAAHADIFGRLRVVVHDDGGKPVQGAIVIFHDPVNVRGDEHVITDADGIALSPPLENHAWQVRTQVVTFETDTRTQAVAADTTADVNVALVKAIIHKTGVTRITGTRNQTAVGTRRDLNFLARFPATAGNPQSLRNYLATNPGIVQDSVNQAHPRGEHSATSIYINGFRLPGAFQGRAGQVLLPEQIQSADVQTGGYAPEYGGETAAVLNVNLRAGTLKPFQSFSTDTGSYATHDGALTFGGQFGAPLTGYTDGQGTVPRQFGYLVDINARSTGNVLEPPQPNNQSTHNHGTSESFFGNFGYNADPRDQFTLSLSDSPARTEIANRTGLSDKYAPVGEGYGYAGIRNADGTVPGGDPAALGGQTQVLPTQEAFGQDVYQNDENNYGNLNYRHTFGGGLTSLFSYGATRSRLDIRNHSPAADQANLPVDSSIEFNPTILKKSSDSEFAGSITQVTGVHTVKVGLLFDKQSGDENYQLIPGSQLALDALYASDPDLAPAGAVQMDNGGNPVVDVINDPVYLANAGATVPSVPVHRSGYYNAAYIQDTWRATRRLSVNYGVRYDAYKQDIRLNSSTQSVKKDFVGPRLNLAYAVTSRTTTRLSYNRLFIQPPLAQGAAVGQTVTPETLNQWEGSVEQQLTPTQSVKVAYYYKDMRNQIDTNLLIPGTQIGVFTSVNFFQGSARGTELSYELTPRGNVGLGAYVAYANSVDKPEGLQNTGLPVPPYNDHDTLNSLSTGLNYTARSGAYAGVNIYHSSGTQSSKLTSLFLGGVVGAGHRQAHTTVNLSFGTPKLAGDGGLELDIENLFDSRQPFNFNSGFTGTRFQQGRRVLLRATGTF